MRVYISILCFALILLYSRSCAEQEMKQKMSSCRDCFGIKGKSWIRSLKMKIDIGEESNICTALGRIMYSDGEITYLVINPYTLLTTCFSKELRNIKNMVEKKKMMDIERIAILRALGLTPDHYSILFEKYFGDSMQSEDEALFSDEEFLTESSQHFLLNEEMKRSFYSQPEI